MQDTWLHIAFNSDISDELGNTVPYPQQHYAKGNKIVYCWLIDGFFETINNIQYLNDIIARFKITFNDCQYLKKQTVERSFINPLKLRYFQNLKSRAVQKIYESTKYDSTKDFIFYCLKLHAEVIIREKGIFSYDELYNFGTDNFIEKVKDRSTLKAKCRNIFNWYLDKDFKLTEPKIYIKKDKGEVMATREQHAKNMTKDREEKARKKVLNVITGMFKDDYKKSNGSWNISKIAKDSVTSRNTVMKYLPKDSLL